MKFSVFSFMKQWGYIEIVFLSSSGILFQEIEQKYSPLITNPINISSIPIIIFII